MKRHWAWRGALAALLTAVGCGPVAAHPGAWPAIPAATLNAMESGSSLRITPLTSAQAIGLARSEATAMRAALAQQPHGSRVLGMTLARVQGAGPRFRQPRLTWLVSVDPFGGTYGAGGPPCGADDFYVAFVDPVTGKWIMATAGTAPGLRPLPVLGPKPTVAPGTRCEHGPVPAGALSAAVS